MSNEITTVTSISELNPSDWIEAIGEYPTKESFEQYYEIELQGEALDFHESIVSNGSITVTNSQDAEDFIFGNYGVTNLYETENVVMKSLPYDGAVDTELHALIVERLEGKLKVAFRGEATEVMAEYVNTFINYVREAYNY